MKKIKFPLVSRKKYEIAIQNAKVLNETKMQVAKKYAEVQKELYETLQINVELGNDISCYVAKLGEKTKEIARLKRLLTKNGIEYKKENK
jgi:hypothetical protein